MCVCACVAQQASCPPSLYSGMLYIRLVYMYLLHVLLSLLKIYQLRTADPELRREPLKPNPKLGEPKTYDSVQVKVKVC